IPAGLRSRPQNIPAPNFFIQTALAGFTAAAQPNGDKSPRHNLTGPIESNHKVTGLIESNLVTPSFFKF
ncbi:hypothetical protein, partial [Pseudomonas sp. N8]|uniref:hypothetical protein n=1 Tax=Pseudomonas sp. N8 TaxID=3449428 RepID=UPI003F6988D1